MENDYFNPYAKQQESPSAAPSPSMQQPGNGCPPRPTPPPCPDNYLVWAILSTVLCCVPFGIVSIVYAARVESRYMEGHYNEAMEYSRKAKLWAIVSAATSAACIAIYLMCLLAFALCCAD